MSAEIVFTEFTAISYSLCEIASFCKSTFCLPSLSSASFLLNPNFFNLACNSSSFIRNNTVPFWILSPSLMLSKMILPAISDRISTSSFGNILPVELKISSNLVDLTTVTMTAVFPPFPPGPPGPPFSFSLPFMLSFDSEAEKVFLIFG